MMCLFHLVICCFGSKLESVQKKKLKSSVLFSKDLEIQCSRMKWKFGKIQLKLGMMIRKAGIFHNTFFKLQSFQRCLNFSAFLYITDNLSCTLKFKCWRETNTWPHFEIKSITFYVAKCFW